MARGAVITKADARRAFGWVPPSKRGESSLISELKEMGLHTKEEFKQYARDVLMPAEENSLGQLFQQNMEQGQKNTQKQAKRLKPVKASNDQAKQRAKAMFTEAQNAPRQTGQAQQHQLKQTQTLKLRPVPR